MLAVVNYLVAAIVIAELALLWLLIANGLNGTALAFFLSAMWAVWMNRATLFRKR